ncbi:MAG: NYN domain-containing protein [Trebonia sp.]
MVGTSSAAPAERVAAYIDGYNLYYGLREHGRRYLWLDLEALMQSLLKPGQELAAVRYFTARRRNDPPGEQRQQTYLNALSAHSRVLEIKYGRFQEKNRRCRNCNTSRLDYEEKESDVALARRRDLYTYWFDIGVGPVAENQIEALGGALESAGGIDATVQADHRGGIVMFSREADGALQAVISAVEDVRAAGMTVTGTREDLVVPEEIAARAKVTTSAVRYWILGERGPGDFPAPRVRHQRNSLYSWAEVSAWLAVAKLGAVDHAAAETARACALVNAALAVRDGMRALPAHDRPLLARLVG